MEQVFQLVNILLSRDRETKERRLSIRPYKVLPLAAKAGVLEFVENTIPMSNWLVGAHSR
jgi:serine-protein kinase ATM